MDKVFNLEIDGQITLPDGSKLGPFYETSINIVQPSSCGCPSDLPASGGAMVIIPCILNPQTMSAELTDEGVAVMDKINTDYQNGNIYPVICKSSVEFPEISVDTYTNLSGWAVTDGNVGLVFATSSVEREDLVFNATKIGKVSGEWVVEVINETIPLVST